MSDERRKEFYRSKGLNDNGAEWLPLLPPPWEYRKDNHEWVNTDTGVRLDALRIHDERYVTEKIRRGKP